MMPENRPNLPKFTLTKFWDRQGLPIDDFLDWAFKCEDDAYRIVEATTVGTFTVSTIWLGLDVMASISGRAPLIFETVVFDDATGEGVFGERYHTESDAREGHARHVLAATEYASRLGAGNGHV